MVLDVLGYVKIKSVKDCVDLLPRVGDLAEENMIICAVHGVVLSLGCGMNSENVDLKLKS